MDLLSGGVDEDLYNDLYENETAINNDDYFFESPVRIASEDPIRVNIGVTGYCWDSLSNTFSLLYSYETGSSHGFSVDEIEDYYMNDDPSELQLTMSPCTIGMGSSEANDFCKYLSSHTWYFYVQGSSTSYMVGGSAGGYVNSCSYNESTGKLRVSMYYK